MAGCQASPPCVPLGLLLLLLIEVLSTYLPVINAKPIDFWCEKNSRQGMMGRILERKVNCSSDVLPSPVQLPCAAMNMGDWENKNLKQKHAEVLEAFQMFQDGVRIKHQTTLPCQTTILNELEHHITNYINILSNATRNIVQSDDQASAYPSGQIFCNKTSLTEVFTECKKLLQGKLNRFAEDLRQEICTERQ